MFTHTDTDPAIPLIKNFKIELSVNIRGQVSMCGWRTLHQLYKCQFYIWFNEAFLHLRHSCVVLYHKHLCLSASAARNRVLIFWDRAHCNVKWPSSLDPTLPSVIRTKMHQFMSWLWGKLFIKSHICSLFSLNIPSSLPGTLLVHIQYNGGCHRISQDIH